MTERKAAKGLDFETLRRAIERCDLELVLGFYAEDVELSIINADAPQGSPFQLRGKAEIAKYLRAAFGQKTVHRVEPGYVGEERVTYREMCDYLDGSRVVIATTLEVRDGKVFRQVDVVAQDAQVDRKEEISQRLPARETYSGVDTPPTDSLLRFKRATEKEDLR